MHQVGSICFLLRAENAVAGITEARNDIGILVEAVIYRRGIDVHVRMLVLDLLDTFQHLQGTSA